MTPKPLTELVARKVNLLGKEVVPFGVQSMHHSGIAIVGNPDPVIKYLSQRGEDTYQIMERSETAISNARQSVDSKILAAGSEVVIGESRTLQAKKLREFAIDFLRRIPRWGEVQERMLDAVYWGWRPIELLWSPQLGRDGEMRWFVHAAIEKSPDRFRFSTDRELVFYDPLQRNEPRVLNTPEDWIQWLPCTSGSIDNPYGVALYQKIWLHWFSKQRFFQLWAQGMERSQGIVTLKRSGPEDATQDAASAWAAVRSEVSQVINKLREANVLVTMPGWETGFLTDVQFADGWEGIIDYCDRSMATSVAGETLSFTEAEFGTRAQATVHERSGEHAAVMRVKKLEGWVNDGLLHRALTLNFGDVDPDDVPKWRSKLGKAMDMDVAKFILANGGKLDGSRIAAEGNVPLATEPEPGQLVLEKAEPAPQIIAPPAPRMPPGKMPPPPKAPMPTQKQAQRDAETVSDARGEELDRRAAGLVDRATAAHEELWTKRLEVMVERYLEENPDPFVESQPAD